MYNPMITRLNLLLFPEISELQGSAPSWVTQQEKEEFKTRHVKNWKVQLG